MTSSGWKKASIVEVLKLIEDRYEAGAKDTPMVFDCDNTLLRGDVGILGAWGLLKSGLVDPEKIPEMWDADHLRDCNFQDFEEMRNDLAMATSFTDVFEMETMLLAGFPVEQAKEIVAEAVDVGIKAGSIRFLEPIGRLAKKYADHSLVVSGSPITGVEAIASKYNIPPERVFATHLNIVDGIFRDEYSELGVIWAETKKTILQNHSYDKVFLVAGDSTGDWNMMELATDFVWCSLWPQTKNPWSTLRQQIEGHLPDDLKRAPQEAGFYIGENTGDNGLAKTWIIEIHAQPGPR